MKVGFVGTKRRDHLISIHISASRAFRPPYRVQSRASISPRAAGGTMPSTMKREFIATEPDGRQRLTLFILVQHMPLHEGFPCPMHPHQFAS
jgi:hypothetical protein